MTTDGSGYAGGSTGRVTLKDMLEANGRIEAKLDTLRGDVQRVTIDHEHRLTEQATKQASVEEDVRDLKAEVSTLRDEHNVARGHVKALAVVAGLMGTTFCGVGGAALAHALHW